MTMTTAAVLKKLRPILPPSFKRLAPKTDDGQVWPAYTDGRLVVEVRGVCQWNATTRERQACHATRIVARAEGFSYRGIVRQRTWQPNKAGVFNWDGIATAIQGMIPELDAHDTRCEKDKAAKSAAERATASNLKALVEMAKRYGLPTEIVERKHRWADAEERTVHGTEVDVNAAHDGCSVTLRHVSLAKAERLFALLEREKEYA